MRGHSIPYEISCGPGIDVTVHPNVFSPKYFRDGLWFAQELPEVVGDGTILEIGTGTGIIALFVQLRGGSVTATDINPQATSNADLNFRRYDLTVPIFEGNLYEPMNEGHRFDFIFWNHPFNRWHMPVHDLLMRSAFDYNYEGLRGYIEGSRLHLSDHGRLLLGTGDKADLGSIRDLAAESGYRLCLLKKSSPRREGAEMINTNLLYELVPM